MWLINQHTYQPQNHTEMGKFEIIRRKDGDYQFNLKATNDEIILTSQGYASKDGCINGIVSVQKNAGDDANYEILEATNGKPYFTLKAANKQVIGTSQMYTSESTMKNGIQSVKENAPSAEIIDLSQE